MCCGGIGEGEGKRGRGGGRCLGHNGVFRHSSLVVGGGGGRLRD